MDYIADYQNYMDSMLNYNMYYTIKSVFKDRNSMEDIRNTYSAEYQKFKDVDALGVFVENHDNARFLHGFGDHKAMKSALALTLTERGIPFMYYGSEQMFGGGDDPKNREPIWNSLDKSSDGYQFVKKIN